MIWLNDRYKVKIIPGQSKRGKASKSALQVFMADKAATNRERDLIKSLKDQDIGRNLPGKVKLAVPQSMKPKKWWIFGLFPCIFSLKKKNFFDLSWFYNDEIYWRTSVVGVLVLLGIKEFHCQLCRVDVGGCHGDASGFCWIDGVEPDSSDQRGEVETSEKRHRQFDFFFVIFDGFAGRGGCGDPAGHLRAGGAPCRVFSGGGDAESRVPCQRWRQHGGVAAGHIRRSGQGEAVQDGRAASGRTATDARGSLRRRSHHAGRVGRTAQRHRVAVVDFIASAHVSHPHQTRLASAAAGRHQRSPTAQ